MPREIVFRLKIGGGTIALGPVDRPVFVFVVLPFPGVPCPVPGTDGHAFGDVSGEKIMPTAYSDRFNP